MASADFSDWNNIDLTSLVDQLQRISLQQGAAALNTEAENIMAVSKERVPVRDGILRGSADAVGINTDETTNSVVVSFGYGGAASAYSIPQHETPPPGGTPDPDYPTDRTYTHTAGQSWKYLEGPVLEAAAGMEQRLASEMNVEKNL